MSEHESSQSSHEGAAAGGPAAPPDPASASRGADAVTGVTEERLLIPRITLGDMAASVFRPLGAAASTPVILFTFSAPKPGDGLMLPDNRARSVASATSAAVLRLDCRANAAAEVLEDDYFNALSWLAAHGREVGLDGTRLALGGEGQAAQVAVQAARMAAAWGSPRLGALVLLRPVDVAEILTDSPGDAGSRQRGDSGAMVRFAPLPPTLIVLDAAEEPDGGHDDVKRLAGAFSTRLTVRTVGGDAVTAQRAWEDSLVETVRFLRAAL